MAIVISVLLQFGVAYLVVFKIKKYIPGAKALLEAYPGLVGVVLVIVAINSMEGRKYISIFPFVFAGIFFVTFANKIYAFFFSLLTGKWRRSWFILDSFSALFVFLGGMSSDLMPYAKQYGWSLYILIIPFLLSAVAFEGSREITSRLYSSVEGKIKVLAKVIIFYSSIALGVASHFALNRISVMYF